MERDEQAGAGGAAPGPDILRQLLNASQEVLYAVALESGRMLYATPSFALRLGLPQDFLDRGYHFSEYLDRVHPDDRDRVAGLMAAMVASRSDASLPDNPATYRLRKPDGGWRTIADTCRVLRNPDGVAHTLTGNARDITEQREAQQALLASEENFRQLIEAWPEQVMLSVNLTEGRHEYVSPSMERVLGYAPQEFYDDPGLGLRVVAPHWRKRARGWLAELRQGVVRPAYEFELAHKSGRHIWVHQVGTLRPRAPGQDLVALFTFREITEERAAREALRTSQAFLDCIIEQSPVAMWIADAEGTLIRSNQALRERLKITDEEVVGRFNIFQDNQAREQGLMPQIRRVHEEGGTARFILAYDTARTAGLCLARTSRTVLDMTISAVQDARGKTTNLIVQHLDISERMRAEAELAASERKYRTLHESMRDGFVAMDASGAIVEHNNAFRDMLGYTDEEMAKRTLHDITPPRWHEAEARIAEEQVFARGYSDVYEKEFQRKDGVVFPVSLRLYLEAAEAGQPRRLWAIARDITEQKRAEAALRESEERFRELVEGTQSLVTQVDAAGRFTYVNPTVRMVLGLEPEDCIGRLAFEIVHPEDRSATERAFQGWLADRLGHATFENRLLSVSGEVRHFSWSIHFQYGPGGEPLVIDSIARDITEQKRAEAALRESEERFRLIVETANEGIWTADAEERATFVNAAMTQMLGYTAEEMLGARTESFLFPEDLEHHARRFELRRAGRDDTYERRFRRKDGTTLWTLASAKPLVDKQGRFAGAFAMFRDITERKRTEEVLHETNARYAILAENVVDVIWSTDEDLRWTFLSPSAEKLTGVPLDILFAREFPEIFTPESLLTVERSVRRWSGAAPGAQAADNPSVLEMGVRHADGRVIPIEVLARPLRDNQGRITGFCGTARDITERKRAEEALRTSEARYALALRGANDGIWDWDLAEGQVYYSDRWKEIIGYAPDEIRHDPEEWTARIHPEDFDQVMEANRRCIQGETPIFQVEYRLRHKDGSYRWIFGRGAALADAAGRVVRMAGAHTDITGRKQAEVALCKSERLSRKLLQSMHEGIWAVDANRRTTFVNERLCAMLGYTPAELMRMSPMEVLEWPQRHLARSLLPDLEAGHTGATDYMLIRKDGTRIPAHVVSSPIMEEQGRFEGLVCGVLDLTERTRMEHELRRSQARFEALYELSRLSPATERQLAAFTLREAIRLTDSAAGVLFFVNGDGKKMVAKAWEDGEFSAARQMPSFTASGPLPWASVLQSGLPLLVNDFSRYAHLVPPGHPKVTRFLGVPVLAGSRPVAVLGLTGKDAPYAAEDTLQTTLLLDGMWRVVRTRRDEERIRASLREKEALLHEVHHRVKNNLQVISSLMDLAGRRLSSPEARLALAELRGKVQAMSLIHAQLQGADSDGCISLERFVRALFHQLREVYAEGLDLSLRLQLGELTLSLDQAVPLGLALNETLTNVFKHACPPVQDGAGRASRVEIRAERDASGWVGIEIEDNGPGLPEGLSPDQADSLGMKLMKGLVRHQLRGELLFMDASPGVRVVIRFQPNVAK